MLECALLNRKLCDTSMRCLAPSKESQKNLACWNIIMGLSRKSFGQYGHPHDRPKKCKFSTGFCLLKSETLRSKISHAGSSLSDSQVNPSANVVNPMTGQKSASLVLDFASLNRKLCDPSLRPAPPKESRKNLACWSLIMGLSS